jgi:glycosyltransferase involved in cell wall biosynthesis
MRLLHVFAGPFPTVQGTQALIGQTCRLLAAAGHDVHLLCYAHSTFDPPAEITVHRIADRPRFRSERSGPALARPVLDISLGLACRRLTREIEPDLIHAHHYEALTAARLADPLRRRPLVFHLHALLGPELPGYFPRYAGRPAALAGGLADRALPRLADRVIVVSEAIRDRLTGDRIDQDRVRLLRPAAEPPPPASNSQTTGGRIRAVYVGNLDAYQGIAALFAGLRELPWPTRSRLRIELVTASRAEDLIYETRRDGLEDVVRIVPHGSIDQAWSRLLGADIALVPRHSPGGAPIKLVNALVAQKAVLLDERLAGELRHGDEAWVVDMRDPRAVADGIERLVDDTDLRRRLGIGAGRAAKRLHDPDAHLSKLESIYGELTGETSPGIIAGRPAL